jgi:hypothetical protein
VRATATRAYPVYAHSLVFCAPASPGSAVCRLTYRLVSGEDAALSAMLAIGVALKIKARKSVSKRIALRHRAPHFLMQVSRN